MLHWRNDLETGHTDIDREHQDIYARLNEIGGTIERSAEPEALSSLIRLLLDYSNRHFRHEESVMNCRHCPMHETNCTAHRDFLARTVNWLAIMSSGAVPPAVVVAIHTELCTWIEQHIARIDTGLRTSVAPVSQALSA